MDNIRTHLGNRIKDLRRMRGLTQDQLAERVNIGPQYLSRLEVGQRSPSLETLSRLAHHLGVELWELFVFDQAGSIKEVRKTMHALMRDADDRTARLALKVVRALTR